MMYVDYVFDLTDGHIGFDNELHLAGQPRKDGEVWGKLPASWKEGDIFKLQVNANGRVYLVKMTDGDGGL